MSRNGKTATVTYKGTLKDGTVFDSTEGKEPLEFKIGSGQLIHGFDCAVAQMKVGESKTIEIEAREAFGLYDESKIVQEPMYAIPDAKDIQVGKLFYFIREGIPFPAKVLEINEGIASIDYNHPLAGQDLTFAIELIAVENE